MAKYIDADALRLTVMRRSIPTADEVGMVTTDDADRYFIKLINDAPTADVVEVRHGEWVEIAENSTGKLIYCTNCNKPINPNRKDVELHRTKEKPDFCPNCGADMRVIRIQRSETNENN